MFTKSTTIFENYCNIPFYNPDKYVNNSTYSNEDIKHWALSLHREAYWIFRACPAYLPLREEELGDDANYWYYIERFMEVDPYSYLYLCDALEKFHRLNISCVFRGFSRLSEEEKLTAIERIYNQDQRSELVNMLISLGFKIDHPDLCTRIHRLDPSGSLGRLLNKAMQTVPDFVPCQ
jgi:hypothetical protein